MLVSGFAESTPAFEDPRTRIAEDRTDLDGTGTVRVTSYRFNAVGSLERVELPNGIDVTYGYDHANRLRSVYADHETQPLARFDYDLRPGGHRWRLTERIGTEQLNGTPGCVHESWGSSSRKPFDWARRAVDH